MSNADSRKPGTRCFQGAKIGGLPRSARFSEPRQGSEFAEEGTAAHTYAELRIRAREDTGGPTFRDANGTTEKWKPSGYANLVIRVTTGPAHPTRSSSRQRLDYTNGSRRFGTGDISSSRTGLEVIDPKYAKASGQRSGQPGS